MFKAAPKFCDNGFLIKTKKNEHRIRPVVRDPKLILPHLHQRTHYKSVVQMYLDGIEENHLDLEDNFIVNALKDVQKVVESNKSP